MSSLPSADDICRAATAVLEDAKAADVVAISLSGKSSIADYMIVATGRSHRQVSALASRLRAALKALGVHDIAVEGESNGDWVLVDANDIIVHIFRPEVREFYNLEKMWTADLPSDSEPASQSALDR